MQLPDKGRRLVSDDIGSGQKKLENEKRDKRNKQRNGRKNKEEEALRRQKRKKVKPFVLWAGTRLQIRTDLLPESLISHANANS